MKKEIKGRRGGEEEEEKEEEEEEEKEKEEEKVEEEEEEEKEEQVENDWKMTFESKIKKLSSINQSYNKSTSQSII